METTTKCNAMCPMCLRAVNGGRLNPILPIVELRLGDVQKILSTEFVQNLDKVFMCGNYGDPAAASEALEIFKWLRMVHPQIQLEIFSNGGIKNEKWWSEIAQVIDKAVFAIDGLADTNHIYRRGVQWAKVEANVQAFTGSGGRARWDYIVFRHNEHQVEEARELSKKWGIREFQVKKTGRFFSNMKNKIKEEHEVYDAAGNVEYTLKKPVQEKYVNAAFETEAAIENEFGSLKNYFEKSEINCKVEKEKSVYLTAEGYVLPCCWLAIRMYPWYSEPKSTEIWKIFDRVDGGIETVNALKHGIEKVLNGEFFQKTLPQSWSLSSFQEGKLFACSKTCGRKDFDLFKQQFV